MDFRIELTDDDIDRVRDRFGEAVVKSLEKRVEKLNETLKWKTSLESCRERFYNTIERHGFFFPEMMVNANGRRFRAILVWHPDHEKFLLVRLIEKEEHYQTSKQHDILTRIHKEPWEVLQDFEPING